MATNREKTFNARLNDREWQKLRKLAEDASVSPSEYFRDWIKSLPEPTLYARQTNQDPI